MVKIFGAASNEGNEALKGWEKIIEALLPDVAIDSYSVTLDDGNVTVKSTSEQVITRLQGIFSSKDSSALVSAMRFSAAPVTNKDTVVSSNDAKFTCEAQGGVSGFYSQSEINELHALSSIDFIKTVLTTPYSERNNKIDLNLTYEVSDDGRAVVVSMDPVAMGDGCEDCQDYFDFFAQRILRDVSRLTSEKAMGYLLGKPTSCDQNSGNFLKDSQDLLVRYDSESSGNDRAQLVFDVALFKLLVLPPKFDVSVSDDSPEKVHSLSFSQKEMISYVAPRTSGVIFSKVADPQNSNLLSPVVLHMPESEVAAVIGTHIAIDTSGSLQGAEKDVRALYSKFLQEVKTFATKGAKNEVTAYPFNHLVSECSETDEGDKCVDLLDDFSGGTALYDVFREIAKKVQNDPQTNKQHVAVVFTDGHNQHSAPLQESDYKFLSESGIRLVIVGVGKVNVEALQYIAGQARGLFVLGQDIGEVSQLVDFSELQGPFTIYHMVHDGKQLTLSVSRQEQLKLFDKVRLPVNGRFRLGEQEFDLVKKKDSKIFDFRANEVVRNAVGSMFDWLPKFPYVSAESVRETQGDISGSSFLPISLPENGAPLDGGSDGGRYVLSTSNSDSLNMFSSTALLFTLGFSFLQYVKKHIGARRKLNTVSVVSSDRAPFGANALKSSTASIPSGDSIQGVVSNEAQSSQALVT